MILQFQLQKMSQPHVCTVRIKRLKRNEVWNSEYLKSSRVNFIGTSASVLTGCNSFNRPSSYLVASKYVKMQGETVSKRATQKSDGEFFDPRFLKDFEIKNSVRLKS